MGDNKKKNEPSNSMAWNSTEIDSGMDSNANEVGTLYPYVNNKNYEIGDPDDHATFTGTKSLLNDINSGRTYTGNDLLNGTGYDAGGSLLTTSQSNELNTPRTDLNIDGTADAGGNTVQPFSYASAPSYASKYQAQIDQLAQQILGRGAFSYDVNSDPLYAQYSDQYTRNGSKAMKDTLGQISARTGGLASTYAGSAAQQTYDSYMQALADKVPELYQLAYSMYQDEDTRDRNNLNLLQNLEDADYSRYKDRLSQYNTSRNQAYNEYLNQLAASSTEETPSIDVSGLDDYGKLYQYYSSLGYDSKDILNMLGERPAVSTTTDETKISDAEKKYYATSMGLSDPVAYDWYIAALQNAEQGETKKEAEAAMAKAGLSSKDIKTILNKINY